MRDDANVIKSLLHSFRATVYTHTSGENLLGGAVSPFMSWMSSSASSSNAAMTLALEPRRCSRRGL